METIKKPFEYIELKAMLMMAAAYASIVIHQAGQRKYKDEVEAREDIEKEVEKIIDIRWSKN